MKNILIVDDSKSMRQMILMTLKSSGFSVVEAEDGAQALNICNNQSFDLIITDVNMPNMNGLEFIQAFRTMINTTTPIICLTTESSDTMKGQGKSVGATGWIVKPFSPEKLISVVNRVI